MTERLKNEFSGDPSRQVLNPLIEYFRDKNFEEALNETNRLLDKYRNSPVLFNLKGVLLKTFKRSEESISFKISISLNENFPDAYYNLGDAYRELGNSKAAISAYERALKFVRIMSKP